MKEQFTTYLKFATYLKFVTYQKFTTSENTNIKLIEVRLDSDLFSVPGYWRLSAIKVQLELEFDECIVNYGFLN